ncbi:MAG TPA: hypothetical protein VF533_20610 [Solirubrobacteraceae bacterium]
MNEGYLAAEDVYTKHDLHVGVGLFGLALFAASWVDRVSKWPRDKRVLRVAGVVILVVATLASLVSSSKHNVAEATPDVWHDAPLVATWSATTLEAGVAHESRLFGRNWQWGGTRLKRSDNRVRISVATPIHEVIECDGWMLVTYGAGEARAALYDPETGRMRASTLLATSNQLGSAICAWDSVFIGMQEGDGLDSYVFRGRVPDLASQAAIDVGGRLGSMAVSRGTAPAKDRLLVSVHDSGEVADIDPSWNYVARRLDGVRDPVGIVAGGTAHVVTSGHQGCIRRLGANNGRPDRYGVVLPGPVIDVERSGNAIIALVDGGRAAQTLAITDLRPLGPPLQLPRQIRGTDLVVDRGGWTVLDTRARQRVTLSTAGRRQLERLALDAAPPEPLERCR